MSERFELVKNGAYDFIRDLKDGRTFYLSDACKSLNKLEKQVEGLKRALNLRVKSKDCPNCDEFYESGTHLKECTFTDIENGAGND